MADTAAGKNAEKTAEKLSVTIEDNLFLKAYTPQNRTAIPGVTQDDPDRLKSSPSEKRKRFLPVSHSSA